jgi:hypothetical protein
VQEAVSQAVWEMGFLFHLHLGLNALYLRDRRALWLGLALAVRDCAEVYGVEKPEPKAVKTAHDCLIVMEEALMVVEESARQVSEAYCAGEELLFPEATAELALMTRVGEQALLLLASAAVSGPAKDGKKKRSSAAPTVDLDALRAGVQPRATERTEQLERLARAEAALLTGDTRRAREALRAGAAASDPKGAGQAPTRGHLFHRRPLRALGPPATRYFRSFFISPI